jgi:uncharacterized protein with NRDE domain
MCLLIVLSHVVDGAPLMVAANRDEFYARPATAVTVLRGAAPRVLGGRDLVAGGTWLAVNADGVLAGLTNQPAGYSPDPAKRTRGELPLLFTAYPDAATAVEKVCARLDPADYNPCWLLVGDRHTLFSVGLAGGHQPLVQELPPGSYVLENVPMGSPSAKVDRVTADVAARLATAREAEEYGVAGAAGVGGAVDALEWVLRGNQVDLPDRGYGTRSAMIVTVPPTGPPVVLAADGPPVRTPFADAAGLWSAGEPWSGDEGDA